MERTLVLLKPDTVKRGLTGEIITRFEKAGLKIIGMKMVSPDESHYHHHYETISKLISRRGEDVFHKNADFMMSGPVIAIVLEGISAVDLNELYNQHLAGRLYPMGGAVLTTSIEVTPVDFQAA
jgi:nucleoside-diphosphate kinase